MTMEPGTVVKSPEEAIAQSVIPYNRDDSRARYLGLRSSGFTIREALKWIGVAASTLSYWRLQSEFKDLEDRIPEFRKKLALEYVDLEFCRNFRLVMEKDYRVLYQSLHPTKDNDGKVIPISSNDQAYLIKMRAYYTPQQLQIMEVLALAESNGAAFDFTNIILEASKTVSRIKIEAKRVDDLPKVQTTDE